MTHPASLSGLHLAFHHLGLAVRRPQEAQLFLSAMGYRLGETVLDPGQNVHLMMCTHETEPEVEIIWPSDTKGPIDGLTQRHPAGIVYHICYVTDDLAAALAALEKAGLRIVCVSPPKPAPLFGGRKVSFYNVVGIGLIEILE
jgi:catechol 2,3-dioxygenase-like lactoylglutathione lyase family enzyme